MELFVLHLVDLRDELRGGSTCLDAWRDVLRLQQRDAGTVDSRDGVRRELRYVAEQFVDAAGVGHQPGYGSHAGMQVVLVGFALCGRQICLRGPTGLRVVISHGAF